MHVSPRSGSAASAPSNDPISYCLVQTVDNSFAHGAIAGTIAISTTTTAKRTWPSIARQTTTPKTGGVCDFASKDTHRSYPNPHHQTPSACRQRATPAAKSFDPTVFSPRGIHYAVPTRQIIQRQQLFCGTGMGKLPSPFHPTVSEDGNYARRCSRLSEEVVRTSSHARSVPVQTVSSIIQLCYYDFVIKRSST